VRYGDFVVQREITVGGGHASGHAGALHFGLGAERRVERVEVRWPSGRCDVHEGLDADAGYRLREGDTVPVSLPGFRDPPASGRRERVRGK